MLKGKPGPTVYIKDESASPFGTFNDRISEFVIQGAVKEKVDTLVLISSGNASRLM